MDIRVFLPSLAITLTFVGCASTNQPSDQDHSKQMGELTQASPQKDPHERGEKVDLIAVLNNGKLWGKDFRRIVLGNAQSLESVGQAKIAVYPDRVEGLVSYADQAEAAKFIRDLNAEVKTQAPDMSFKFKSFEAASRSASIASTDLLRPAAARIEMKTANSEKPLELLPPNLKFSDIKKELRNPETVQTKLIQTEYERRPITITYYSYADGALTYAVSDMSPDEDTIQGVVIDTSRISEIAPRSSEIGSPKPVKKQP
jgi:hypothetical protein